MKKSKPVRNRSESGKRSVPSKSRNPKRRWTRGTKDNNQRMSDRELDGLIRRSAKSIAKAWGHERTAQLAVGQIAYEHDLAVTGGKKAKNGEDAFKEVSERLLQKHRLLIDPRRIRERADFYEQWQRMDGYRRTPSLSMSHYLVVSPDWFSKDDKKRFLLQAEAQKMSSEDLKQATQLEAISLLSPKPPKVAKLDALLSFAIGRLQQAAITALESGTLTDAQKERARNLIVVLYLAFFGGEMAVTT